MPEMRIKEVRLPELRLPEMSRDEISRVVGDATRDIDLTKLDPRRIDVPEIDLAKIDIPKAVTAAAEKAGIVKPRRRPAGLMVLGGLLVLGLVAFAVMTSPTVRPRLEEVARRIRSRIDERRGVVDEMTDTSVIGVPIEPSAYRDESPTASPFDDTISTVGEPSTQYEDAPVAAGTIADTTTPSTFGGSVENPS